ncbi:helix-turn-helix domain-containing protein [Rhizobium leguminosarum]|uniref:helix-turn-helix domain-containing protein n=1 Tax=Rhizobium leguminosarum TaxID=384 RepID=UPI003518C4B4
MARLNAGETIRSIAAALAIAPSCVSKWKKRLAETGALTRGRVGGRKHLTCPASGPTGCANAANQDRSRRGALWRNWPNAASKPERRAV